ncbi:MAG: helix-turn-helix domain-containing protein [Patescibacteria group bacterium]|nr:helix-turn-helix domain-containing protein [Patescibacteria group bacterium]
MVSANKKTIKENQELISDELRRIRNEKNISIEKIAKDLGINEKYLKSLEAGDRDALPEGLYGKNFLKRYAVYLGFDPKEIAQEYFDIGTDKTKNNKNVFTRKVPSAFYFLTIPRLVRNFFLLIFVLILFSYLAYAIYNVISPPILIINSPELDYQTIKKSLLVSGVSEKEADVRINNDPVLVSDDGSFEKLVNLQTGINTITVSAQMKYSHTKYESRRVLVSSN